ncbi:uncharacterized protein LOC128996980 [Macrosteles quadrilineatus]|uniref:uncharacterized protein LOC128996980 n=1 Tax=Macrosteles quadrilineatus TaxID=74068 RepID=UPI0023E2CC5D|nr:uncharacterized protein LOC128996980 [Macrosteles quadrilineatus]
MDQKVSCKYCFTSILKKNLKRHERYCSKNALAESQSFKCDICQNVYTRSESFKTHFKSCRGTEGTTSKKASLTCSYSECGLHFKTITLLINHLKSIHNAAVLDSQTLSFENEKNFIAWKEEEEARTFSYFSKKSGDKLSSKGDVVKSYYCQQHGSDKAHKKIGEPSKKTDRRVSNGRVKTNKTCISKMKATFHKNGSVIVIYYPTHSHPLHASSIQFQPLSSETYNYIDAQLAAGVSPLVIKRQLKDKAVEKASILDENVDKYKDCFVSLKLIKERARRRRISKMFDKEDARSVMLLTDHLIKEDPDMVLIYKPLGMPCQIGPEEINNLPDSNNIFMFGLQTKDQRQLMVEGCKLILLLDETHCTNQYGFTLLNLLIVDEKKRGWPVGHFITNRSDERCLELFFKALKSKIPQLDINCVITDDDPKLINAIEKGFEEELRHILCLWHLTRNFKKQLREKAPRDLIPEMFVSLKLMIEAKTYSEFEQYSDAFLSKFKDEAPDFVSYLKQYYLTEPRKQKWAKCHRNFYHGEVDTTNYIESFHNRLKTTYMERKPNRRLDTLIQLLITISEDDSWSRKRNDLFDIHQGPSFDLRHKRGIQLLDNSIKNVSPNLWEVTSAKATGKVYQILRNETECTFDLCFFICRQCPGLCSHLYTCSCEDIEPLCKHVHKLHSYLSRDVVVAQLNTKCESNELFFSESAIEENSFITTQEIQKRHIEIQRRKLKENIEKLMLLVEDDGVPVNVLDKLNNEVVSAIKHAEVSMKNSLDMPVMCTSETFAPNQKLKTQLSQLLPFKRPNKRKKSFDVVAAANKKKSVSADLLSLSSRTNNESQGLSEEETLECNS